MKTLANSMQIRIDGKQKCCGNSEKLPSQAIEVLTSDLR